MQQVLARREGLSQREIARRLGISRVTVKRALGSEGPPGYERGPRSSGFDAFEAQVMLLLRDFPRMPVTVIAQRVSWPGSITNLLRHVRGLRPLTKAKLCACRKLKSQLQEQFGHFRVGVSTYKACERLP